MIKKGAVLKEPYSCKAQSNASAGVHILLILLYIIHYICREVNRNKFHFCLSAFILIGHLTMLPAVCKGLRSFVG